VVRVKTQLMALHRRSARQPGKSDPIDAHAVAMAALREENLPIAQLDESTREVKLLSDHRRNLVCERTKLINRLRWHLHELDPELVIPVRGIRRYRVMDELAERLTAFTGVVAQIAGELLDRCRQLTEQVNDLERQIRDRVRRIAPSLLAIPGCGVLSAAVIIGETADARRFHSKDAYAKFNGTAPIPVWSAHERVRLNRGGNRAVNAALHAIATRSPAAGRARTTWPSCRQPGRRSGKQCACSADVFPTGCFRSCASTSPRPETPRNHRFVDVCRRHGIQRSRGRVGSSYDKDVSVIGCVVARDSHRAA
jgi:transposase